MKSGIAFHCHHDVLYEYVYDYDERVECIKKDKPKDEQELRLRLFRLIPDNRLPGRDSLEYIACNKAREAYYKAKEICGKARETCNKARKTYCKTKEAKEAFIKAEKAYDKAGVTFDRVGKTCNKASEAYCKTYGKEMKQLHAELCPDCPWDGKTIFSK